MVTAFQETGRLAASLSGHAGCSSGGNDFDHNATTVAFVARLSRLEAHDLCYNDPFKGSSWSESNLFLNAYLCKDRSIPGLGAVDA